VAGIQPSPTAMRPSSRLSPMKIGDGSGSPSRLPLARGGFNAIDAQGESQLGFTILAKGSCEAEYEEEAVLTAAASEEVVVLEAQAV